MLVLDSEIVMESLDVHSRFTNIRLKETFNIYANTLFENTEGVEGLSKIQFREVLSVASKKFYFIFNGKLCKQYDGVAMDSPLCRILPNALKRIGYKIVHLTLSPITTDGIFIISLFCSPNRNT